MRLLPKTPRGTWLLAGIVWLAVCAALWWALPVRPRAEWVVSVPEDESLQVAGFPPGPRALVAYSSRSMERLMDPNDPFPEVFFLRCGPLRFWEVDSGQVVEWFDAEEVIYPVAFSPDGAWVAVHHGRLAWPQLPRMRLQLFERATGRARFDLPLLDSEEVVVAEMVFSPDSRWLACSAATSDRLAIYVFDVATGRERCVLRLADDLLAGDFPLANDLVLAFAPDGRTLAVTFWDDMDAQPIQIWDLDTGRMTRTLSGPTSQFGCFPVFSPDGRHLVAQFAQPIDQFPPDDHQLIWCWDVASGAERFRVDGSIAAVTDRLWLYRKVNRDQHSSYLVEPWDYAGKKQVQFGPIVPRQDDDLHEFSPDGRIIAFESPVPNPIRDWVIARGLPWPFAVSDARRTRFVDVQSGQEIGQLPPRPTGLGWVSGFMGPASGFSVDGQLYWESDSRSLRIWDVPPRKPLAWFSPLAVLLALPFVWLARRRASRLRIAASDPTRARG